MVYCLLYTILHVAIIVASADAGLGLTVRAGLIPLLHLVSREANDAAVGHPIAACPLDVVQDGTVPSQDLVAVGADPEAEEGNVDEFQVVRHDVLLRRGPRVHGDVDAPDRVVRSAHLRRSALEELRERSPFRWLAQVAEAGHVVVPNSVFMHVPAAERLRGQRLPTTMSFVTAR